MGWSGRNGWEGECGGAIEMGAGQGWAEHNARVSVGHRSFWEPAQPPPGGPSGVQGYMVSARQVHLPCYLCPAHASTLLSLAPSAPYGNDLLLPDLADTHGSPSAYSTMASVPRVQPFKWRLKASDVFSNLWRESLHSQWETVVDLDSSEGMHVWQRVRLWGGQERVVDPWKSCFHAQVELWPIISVSHGAACSVWRLLLCKATSMWNTLILHVRRNCEVQF